MDNETPKIRKPYTQRRKRPPHLLPLETSGPVVIFITVCTNQRRPLLARPAIHELLRAAWDSAKLWTVGRYVVMPDHIHLFASPAVFPMESLVTWVRYWKSHASRNWPFPVERPVWQTDFWDTQLRRAESYSAKWEYVRNNPVRAGLADRPDAWLFQGEMAKLPWYA